MMSVFIKRSETKPVFLGVLVHMGRQMLCRQVPETLETTSLPWYQLGLL